jgi:hypothetical protein
MAQLPLSTQSVPRFFRQLGRTQELVPVPPPLLPPAAVEPPLLPPVAAELVPPLLPPLDAVPDPPPLPPVPPLLLLLPQPIATARRQTVSKVPSLLMYSPSLLMQAHSGDSFEAEL